MRPAVVWLLLSLFLWCSGAVQAKVKIEDRSAHKRPEWVGGYERNAIIKSARGATLDQAKALVEAAVKDEIARSVGEYISAADLTQIGQIGGQIQNDYSAQIRTEAVGVLRLTEVDMSTARGFYWERCRDRRAKQTYYEYHILYPFGQATKDRIVGYYQALEAEIIAQINQYEQALETFTSYEELEEHLGSLKVFYDYYKDNRRVKIRNLIARYLSVFQAMVIVPVECGIAGVSRFAVHYKGRSVSIGSMPTVYVGQGNGVQKVACDKSILGWEFATEPGAAYEVRFSLTYVKLNYKHIAK